MKIRGLVPAVGQLFMKDHIPEILGSFFGIIEFIVFVISFQPGFSKVVTVMSFLAVVSFLSILVLEIFRERNIRMLSLKKPPPSLSELAARSAPPRHYQVDKILDSRKMEFDKRGQLQEIDTRYTKFEKVAFSAGLIFCLFTAVAFLL